MSQRLRERFEPLRAAHWPAMRALIDDTVARTSPGDGGLRDTCDYHLESGGKRLRATLPLITAEALGADPAPLVAFGAACEVLHNATLIHDDLQDGDTLRRGRETVWRRFGTARAINLGDAMFYYPLALLQQVPGPADRRDRALTLLVNETLRVIDGQERELAMREASQVSLAEYLAMVEGKTSGLFAVPMQGAALLCGESLEVAEAIGEAARHLGVLFQIQDDLLDLSPTKGRDQRGSDIAEGKRSILAVHALNSAPAEDAAWLLAVLDTPRELTSADDRNAAIELFERCAAIDFARQQLAQRRRDAVAAVAGLERPEITHLVEAIADLFVTPLATGEPLPPRQPVNAAADLEFCATILPEVSRTFALSIAALPDELRDAVLSAYLLCRIVDTIEDEAGIEPQLRERLFDSFSETLRDNERGPAAFEKMVGDANLGGDTPDGRLARRAGAALRLFRRLPMAQRKVIRPRVLVMLEGMRSYCRRSDRSGRLRIRDLEELEQYCYYVAGAVGRLLTDLFQQSTPGLDAERRRLVADTAVSFGIGLQLVNIVKDVAEDLERGICFLPESLAAHHGIELADILEPHNRSRGLAIVRAVCARARFHLERAQQYTLAWPADTGEAVRLFCAVPLTLALATLEVVESGEDTLIRGETPKISRETVGSLLLEARNAVGDDQRLGVLLGAIVEPSAVPPLRPAVEAVVAPSPP